MLSGVVASPRLLAGILARWNRSGSAEAFSAENLSTVFSYLLGRPAEYAAARALIAEQLLNLTISRAQAVVPFYKKLAPITCGLADIPPIDRGHLSNNPSDFLAEDTSLSFVTFTSGTTNGVPLHIERSPSEQIFLHQFFSCGILKREGPRPIALNVATSNHGSVIQLPSDGMSFTVDLRETTALKRALHLLGSDFTSPSYDRHISIINSSFRKLFLFYNYIIANGYCIRKGQIKSIFCYGGYIPRREKILVERFFGTEINDTWSMSEFFGPATSCKTCHGFHVSPFIHAEVIPLNARRGPRLWGELVVTPLFPFNQRTAILRYKTGDYVEKIVCADDPDCFVFKYKGRIKDCIPIDDDKPLLSSTDLWDVLDEYPDIRRNETRNFANYLDSSVGQLPRYRASCAGHTIQVKLYLCYEPSAYPERVGQIRDEIVKRFEQTVAPEIKAALNNGTLILDINFFYQTDTETSFFADMH